MSARFLLRLDDACPTLDGGKWRRIEVLFADVGIKPIVAIIPDNRDPALYYSAEDAGYWDRVRAWQDQGWAIALHGFQHMLRPTRASQILRFHARSEFAGLPYKQQANKIRRGWAMLAEHGVTPTVWVAPAHSFDATTLKALANETPIRIISDGIARDQYFEDEFHWLPQQLWSLTPKRDGLWTVCLHPNTMSDDDFRALEEQLRGPFAGAITGVADVRLTRRRRSLGDRIEELGFWRRHYLQRGIAMIKKIVRR